MAIAVNFKDLKVGVERASVYASLFEAKLPEAEVVFYDTSEALYINLQNGDDNAVADYRARVEARLGYGFALRDGVLTPYGEMTLGA